MGWETAAFIFVHALPVNPSFVTWTNKKESGLHESTDEILKAVRQDWKTWKKDGYDHIRWPKLVPK